MIRAVAIAILLLSKCAVWSATYTAASASYSDVNTAVGLASHGDIVEIPAGAAAWSSKLSISGKGIVLKGAGRTQTFITNNVGGGDYLIQITLSADQTNRVTGICFVGGTGTAAAIYCTGESTDARRLRVDNCTSWQIGSGFLRLDTVLGVAHHNYIFGNQPGNEFAHLKGSTWGGLTRGNGAWTNATPRFGTEEFFFFEDNLVETTNAVFILSTIDSQAGARWVYRYNTNLAAYVEGHGSEAAYERSTHAVEIYMNRFHQSNVNQQVTFFRGGVGVIWSNRIDDITGPGFFLEDNRRVDNLFGPYWGSDGRNPWDSGNAAAVTTGTASSAGTLTVTDSGKSWTVNQWVGAIVRRTSGKAVSSMTRSGTMVTVDTSAAHGFSTGNLVSIFGADQEGYNGLYSVTVVDADTFTFSTVGNQPTSPATGTIKCALGTHYSEISANTATQLTFRGSIYGASAYLSFSTSDTFEINYVTNAMDMVGRIGGTLTDSSATPAIPGGWNNQTAFPWYQWNNDTGNESPSFSPAHDGIKAGLHFTNAVYSYTPYTYPHPMASGIDPNPPAAASRGIPIRGIRLHP